MKAKDNLLILPADKGRATVIMKKEEYDHKIDEMLSDEKTYQLLKHDPAPCRLNATLLELKKKGSLPPELYDRLRSSGGLTPCLYGLPKVVHKPGVPL